MNQYLGCCIIIACVSQSIYAHSCPDATAWMESMNARVIKAVQGEGEVAQRAQTIQSVFQPSLDIDTFTKKIVGRNDWLAASNAQQQQLKKNIVGLMLHDYSQAVVETLASTPKVYRVRDGDASDKVAVTVLYHTQRGKNLLAIFSLKCQGSAWKIYDISVEGVRLSDLQQSKYSQVLKESGVVGLNNFLESIEKTG